MRVIHASGRPIPQLRLCFWKTVY